MMRLVRSGIVRTGGCDGCGAIGDTVTASPEEHEDMPVGGGQVRGGRVWVGWLSTLQPLGSLQGSIELAQLGVGLNRVGLDWDRKASRAQLATDRLRPTREEHNNNSRRLCRT